MVKQKILYISYDGLLEPLGESQVLGYQEQLAKHFDIHIISFEKPQDMAVKQKVAALRRRVKQACISWHPRRYHKQPSGLATAFDVLVGVLTGLLLIRRHQIGIVHARSYVAAVIALTLKKLTGAKFIFDMRGFWADERVDGGLWPANGRMYRLAKWFEHRFLLNADHVISLTQAAATEIKSFDYLQAHSLPITIIPTCADLDRFCLQAKNPKTQFVLGYVGSVGTWYLFDDVLRVFIQLLERRSDAQLLILNRGGHDYINDRLQALDIPPARVEVIAADHNEVAAQMARMSAGVFFYKPSYSRLACAPTKLGEFLGCGIPCLANTGVGDMAQILSDDGVGITLTSFSDESISTAVDRLIELVDCETMRQRCRDSALHHFSLVEGVKRYQTIYESLL